MDYEYDVEDERSEFNTSEIDWGEEPDPSRSGEEEYDPKEESWPEDDNSQGGYEEELDRGELNHKPPDSKQIPTYQTPYTSEHEVTLNFNYKSGDKFRFYEFSGSRRDYLQWESRMDEYFRCYSIPRGERLTYCLDQLRGAAKRWWYQEEDYRWYYKEPTIRTWGQLKWIMRKRYAPHSLTEPRKTTYLLKESSRRDTIPSLVQNATPKVVTHQGKCSARNNPLELRSCMYKNRGHIAKELPSKKVTSSSSSSCKKHVSQDSVKRGILPAHTEVSISTTFRNIDQLFDKAIHLIKSTRVEKGLGTKKDVQQKPELDTIAPNSSSKSLLDPQSKEKRYFL